METSPSIKEIASALKELQAFAVKVTKDAKANYGKYATLENVVDTIRIPMSNEGLSFSQFPDGVGLTTIIMHTSGEWIKATAALHLDKQTPQGQGSAITYMRRYALSAALGLATEDDDDGNTASAPRQAAQKPLQRTETAKTTPDTNKQEKALKDRIMGLLKEHDAPCGTKQECSDSVFEITGLALRPDTYQEVAEALSAKLEAKEAQQ